MGSIELVTAPVAYIDKTYQQLTGDGLRKQSAKDLKRIISTLGDKFRSAVVSSPSSSSVPSLNTLKSGEWKDGMLVRFRGMVQDMFESEIFLADFPSSCGGDEAAGKGRQCGLFRDPLPVNQMSIDPLSGECTLLDRQSLYCVPVPGESFWVKEFDAVNKEKEGDAMQTDASSAQAQKRPCNDDEMNGEHEDSSPKKAKLDDASNLTATSNSAAASTSNSDTKLKQFQLNFPLANEKGPAVIVKIYDSTNNFKVCDVCEFVGILALDQPSPPSSDSAPMMVDMMDMETETQLQSPPTSLVPRIHVIFVDKIALNNPLLASKIKLCPDQAVDENENSDDKQKQAEDVIKADRDAAIAKELKELSSAKVELVNLLKTLLMGDALAAEYFLCHLVSSVHSRRDLRPIGKMTFNISNCPSGLPLGKRISQVLEHLCPSVDRVPMSLPVLNGPPFVPVKDYEANRLLSSRLQLAKWTEIVLDETVLSPGQLNEKGVRNLTILGNLIQWQKLDYDFKWTTQEFPTDLRMIVVSEGKSILPSDFQFHLGDVNVDADQYDANLNNAMTSLAGATIQSLRRYLSLVQAAPYQVDAQVQKMVEEDFVAARAENERNLTVEDFERLLLLSRYVTLTEFHLTGGSLTAETWQRCKQMEVERKRRIPVTRNPPSTEGPVRVGVEQ